MSSSNSMNPLFTEVKYENLKSLATSRNASQIRHLKLNVPAELDRLEDVHYISTKYFVNIQQINVCFVNSNRTDLNQIPPYTTIDVTELDAEVISIRGLIIEPNQYVKNLAFEGHDWIHTLKISHSKFNGVGVGFVHFKNFEMESVQFSNSPEYGFCCNGCKYVNIKNISISNCKEGMAVLFAFEVFVSNIKVQQCQEDGCVFERDGFLVEITNARISKCRRGLHLECSNVELRDVAVSECRSNPVYIKNSAVQYEQLLCINNAEKVKMEQDYQPGDEEAYICKFVQGIAPRAPGI